MGIPARPPWVLCLPSPRKQPCVLEAAGSNDWTRASIPAGRVNENVTIKSPTDETSHSQDDDHRDDNETRVDSGYELADGGRGHDAEDHMRSTGGHKLIAKGHERGTQTASRHTNAGRGHGRSAGEHDEHERERGQRERGHERNEQHEYDGHGAEGDNNEASAARRATGTRATTNTRPTNKHDHDPKNLSATTRERSKGKDRSMEARWEAPHG